MRTHLFAALAAVLALAAPAAAQEGIGFTPGGGAAVNALAPLTPAADKCLYYTGASTAALIDCPGRGRDILSNGYTTEAFCFALSDETTALTTGTAKVTFRMPYAFTVTAVYASVTTAPTGATFILDINGAGPTSLLSTKLSIDISELTSTTAASAAVISDSTLAADEQVTFDFDQVGSTVAGAGAKACIVGHQT